MYRLPTEAEWEYACRAGSRTAYYTGSMLSSDQANFCGIYTKGGKRRGKYRRNPTEVGSFSPNAFGLYDMHGNVYEWCSDWYGAGYYCVSPDSNPRGPSSGTDRVCRGGSWRSGYAQCRSVDRWTGSPDYRSMGYGFRVVCSASTSRARKDGGASRPDRHLSLGPTRPDTEARVSVTKGWTSQRKRVKVPKKTLAEAAGVIEMTDFAK